MSSVPTGPEAPSRAVSRRGLILSAGAVAGLAACTTTPRPAAPAGTAGTDSPGPTGGGPSSAAPGAHGRVLDFELGAPIGDGSTSEARPQPGLVEPTRLKPGETPPQLVVISWDGAGALPNDQLARFREVAKRTKAHMTLFLSGMYCVPQEKKTTYKPPAGHRPGSSAINFLTEASVHRTIKGIGEAWVEGHEIGTHFNGHWCGPKGVASWSTADWRQETHEAIRMVTSWKTITGFTDLPALPFDYRTELIGSRTPCLEGRKAMLPVAKELGWRYDTSATALQTWPHRLPNGLWDLSMPSVPFRTRSAIAMDYNFMFQQSGAHTKGDPTKYATWQAEVSDALTRGLQRALDGNRAPLVVGNHFEQWNGGIYMNAVEQFMDHAASHPEVRLVSFRELVDWLEAQDPAVLAKLQQLRVGEKPRGGWAEYLGGAAAGGQASPDSPTSASPASTATASR